MPMVLGLFSLAVSTIFFMFAWSYYWLLFARLLQGARYYFIDFVSGSFFIRFFYVSFISFFFLCIFLLLLPQCSGKLGDWARFGC
jgi:hypothetical protein